MEWTKEAMETATLILAMAGGLAFITAAVVETVKELPVVRKLPTSAVAFAASLIFCPLGTWMICRIQTIDFSRELLAGSLLAAFPVYLIATGGWERIHQIMERTRFSGTDEDFRARERKGRNHDE